jgi:NADPH-dependent 2,4-dienoyl-CoA reductase/sulfur reductase-like enzyme/rhodanese-related sulfurtransferase
VIVTNSEPTVKKIVIVGGVAGGMSAAARARRLSEKSEIIVLERSGYVSYANCGLPYFLGGEIESREDLVVQTPASLLSRFNLDIRVRHEVVEIDQKAKHVSIKDLTTGNTYRESYDDLILSTGASAIKPRVKGIDLAGLFALRSIEDVESIKKWFYAQKPRRAVIAGGGFIGLEMAEQLIRKGLSVTLIDSKEQVLAPIDPEMAALAHNELRKQGVKLVLGAPISAFLAPEEKISSFSDAPKSCWVLAGDNEPMPADLVILGLGIRPEVSLAREAGLVIGDHGGIRVNEKLQTSSPNIWAVGDAIEVRHPVSGEWTLIALGGPANRQGRIAANNILGASESYNGTIGTAVLRIFDLTVASVGLNEGQLKTSKIPYELVYVHPTNHASYYPGAARLDMKVLFNRATGVLLGAQVIGKDGADKRIDILATAIKGHMTIRDLAELELAYAPPFGSAKDPINLAGMAGTNLLDGILEQVHYDQIATLIESGVCLIDVRSAEERAQGFIRGSIHIPLPELRKRLFEIPSEKNIVTYCQSGQRSYIAYRQLKQKGFNVKSLSGGYLTWSSIQPADQTSQFAQKLAPSMAVQ